MNLNDYDFYLPENLIAQSPILKRDESRLLVLDKEKNTIEHRYFKNIIDYINPGDALVINNTKVIPARLLGTKEDTKAIIELLLLSNKGDNTWECLAKPAKRLKIDTIISFGKGELKAKVISKSDEGIILVEFAYKGIFLEILDELGEMPLPPYIHEKLKEKNRYQTVYAKNVGSVAAPTAGLHFTNDLLKKLRDRGVIICEITLHVGLGTFRPVTVENITEHKMHTEYFTIDKKTAKKLNKVRYNGNKIIAVGTTTVRTLESVFDKYNEFKSFSGYTDIFIYPGYKFKVIDALITNFHLPKSTLIMLVSALTGRENILSAYKEAIEQNYRFFSFGDAMLIK